MRKLIIAVLAPFIEDIVAHLVDESAENLERFIKQSNEDLTEEIDNQGLDFGAAQIDPGGETCRSATQDDHIILFGDGAHDQLN